MVSPSQQDLEDTSHSIQDYQGSSEVRHGCDEAHDLVLHRGCRRRVVHLRELVFIFIHITYNTYQGRWERVGTAG